MFCNWILNYKTVWMSPVRSFTSWDVTVAISMLKLFIVQLELWCIFVFTCVENISQLQTDSVVKQCENPQISFRSVFAECLGDARDSRRKSKTSCIAHMSGSMARSLLWSCRVTISILKSKIDWKKLQFNNQSEVQYQWLPCRFTRKKNWSKLNR